MVKQDELDQGYQRWEVLYSVGKVPPPEEDGTSKQLSALRAALAHNTLYASFSSVMPHEQRLLRKHRARGAPAAERLHN